MKKRQISSKFTVYFIVSFLFITTSLIPVIADTGDNKGDGNGDTNPPSPPPNDPNNDSYGNAYNNSEQNKDQNTDNKDTDQNREQNQNEEQNRQQNQSRKQKREGENADLTGEKMRYQQREMEMVFEKNRTRIRSGWDQDEYEDEFEILFDIEQEPRLIFNYKNNIHSSENDLSFQLKIIELIEYRDTNNNGRYDEEDAIVNVYSFGDVKFKNITHEYQLSDDGKELNHVSTQTEDDVFKMNLYYSGNYSNIGNQILSPSEAKIDFIINNYPFEEESTQLALRTMLETQHEIKLNIESFDEMQGFSENESVLDITTSKNNGFFSWAEIVDVDNITRKVNSTIQSQIIETIIDNEKISNKVSNIYFSYPRGSKIVHDPKIGVVSISFEAFSLQSIGDLINMDNIILYIGICILASIMFLGVIFIRKRI